LNDAHGQRINSRARVSKIEIQRRLNQAQQNFQTIAQCVPQGHLKIARRFNAGNSPHRESVPQGWLKMVFLFSRPSGTRSFSKLSRH